MEKTKPKHEMQDQTGMKYDSYGQLTPTREAFYTARRILREAEKELGKLLPLYPDDPYTLSVNTDSKGGIRITWARGDRELQLICPADSDTAHLCHEQGEDYGLEYNVDGKTLAQFLRNHDA